MSKPYLHPITLREARAFVDRHHRHHKAPQRGLFAIGLGAGDEVVGVAIVGRPVSRMLQNGFTAEVTRLCIAGEVKNGCSQLYSACWRAARALGYQRLITYILDSESGVSLKASNWKLVGNAGGGSWSRESRPRVDLHPTQGKFLWEKRL